MFNKKHPQTRVVVETGFGALKNRVRRLNTEITLDIQKVLLVTYATYIPHNICIIKHDPYMLKDLEAVPPNQFPHPHTLQGGLYLMLIR